MHIETIMYAVDCGMSSFPTPIPDATQNGKSGADETVTPRSASGRFRRNTNVSIIREITWKP